MKLRSVLLAFAASLLTVSLASASTTAPAEVPAAPAGDEAALLFSAEEEAECPNEELAFLDPAPDQRANGPCGTCSSQNCRNGQVGQGCGFSGGRWYTCQIPYSEYCTDGKPKCYCWTGQLP